jgi:hypothetical protein
MATNNTKIQAETNKSIEIKYELVTISAPQDIPEEQSIFVSTKGRFGVLRVTETVGSLKRRS